MRISDLIETLTKYHNQDEEIIVAWWERDLIEEWQETKITDEEWLLMEDAFMNSDWSGTDEILGNTLMEIRRLNNVEKN